MTGCPNLFLIGAAKGGSTSFAFHLHDHPDIAFFAQKEPNFFNQPDVAACRAALEAKAPAAPKARYLLDASVNYSQYPKFAGVPEHIAEICGRDVPRIMYMMRNPVDRAVSQYFWRRERYGEDRPIHEVITEDSQYVLSSRYDVQIERYLAVFDRAQMRFLTFDTYYADVMGQYARVCDWLDLPVHRPQVERVKGQTNKQTTLEPRAPMLNRLARSSPGLRSMVKSLLPHKRQLQLTRALSKEIPREDIAPEDRARLAAMFQDSIARTEELTGLDLSAWKAPVRA